MVALDADEECPSAPGSELKTRVSAVAQPESVSIVIPKYEFETWFLFAAESLRGKRGLRGDLSPPRNPEAIRGAKEWLSRNMIPGRAYSSTVDQAALVAGMDLTAAKRWRSFDRLWREIARLIDAIPKTLE